ncbi:MAG: sigma-70 family RNA polymerase sigma factor [bacterium]|nr:sigma-70 family RNA polymerase sigma factor [bacterium]
MEKKILLSELLSLLLASDDRQPAVWHTPLSNRMTNRPGRGAAAPRLRPGKRSVDQGNQVNQGRETAEGSDAAGRGHARRVPREEIERVIANFQRGVDREASFQLLYDIFYEPTRHFLARRVSSPEDRLDLTQETFLRVYKGLKGYRGDAQFGTWLFRIAHNTYLKWLRRLKTDEAGPDVSVQATEESETTAYENDELIAVSHEHSPLERTLRGERHRALREAIEELPEQMRRCTELRIYHDLSYREISVVMRRSIETVKVHLFQARKKLKGALGDIELGTDLGH